MIDYDNDCIPVVIFGHYDWNSILFIGTTIIHIWLVVSNIFYFPYIGNSNPN